MLPLSLFAVLLLFVRVCVLCKSSMYTINVEEEGRGRGKEEEEGGILMGREEEGGAIPFHEL